MIPNLNTSKDTALSLKTPFRSCLPSQHPKSWDPSSWTNTQLPHTPHTSGLPPHQTHKNNPPITSYASFVPFTHICLSTAISLLIALISNSFNLHSKHESNPKHLHPCRPWPLPLTSACTISSAHPQHSGKKRFPLIPIAGPCIRSGIPRECRHSFPLLAQILQWFLVRINIATGNYVFAMTVLFFFSIPGANSLLIVRGGIFSGGNIPFRLD